MVHLIGAIAAAIVVIVMLTPLMRQERESGRPDEPRVSELQSLIQEGEPLPRRLCLLRWSALPDGTLYTLEVTTEDLLVLHRAENVEPTEYLVPESALRDLPSGATFLWRVEALLPDASRVSSPAFPGTLE
jgi:hypothetical protein